MKLASLAVLFGISLYLSKFFRGYFQGHDAVLFVLGFLPNFGLAFTLPFIYVSNRIRLNKPIVHFVPACGLSFLLMVLNELRDKYQVGRVFDVNDIYASLAGVILAILVYYRLFKP